MNNIVLLIVVLLALVGIGVSLYLQQTLIRRAVQYRPYNRRRKGKDYIYFFRGRNEPFWCVKIGRARDPLARLQAHRTAQPYGIAVLGVLAVRDDVYAELYLHRKFARSRIRRNNEWFYMTPHLWLTIKLLRDPVLTEDLQRCLHP